MKAKINGIEVEGTPQEVAELAKLLEARVEVKQPATEKELEDIKRWVQEREKSNIPW